MTVGFTAHLEGGVVTGHQPCSRVHADHAAVRTGEPGRPTAVCPDRDRKKAGGRGRRPARTRPSRSARGIPGIPGLTSQLNWNGPGPDVPIIVLVPTTMAPAERRRVTARSSYAARCAPGLDEERHQGHAGDRDMFLDRYGDPVQRPGVSDLLRVEEARLFPRPFGIHMLERLENGIESLRSGPENDRSPRGRRGRASPSARACATPASTSIRRSLGTAPDLTAVSAV